MDALRVRIVRLIPTPCKVVLKKCWTYIPESWEAKYFGVQKTILNLQYLKVWLGFRKVTRSQEHTLTHYSDWYTDLKRLRRPWRKKRVAVRNNRFQYVDRITMEGLFVSALLDGFESRGITPGMSLDILDVGAGYGRIVMPLSCLFPNSKFHGIEYTSAGPETAKHYEGNYRHEIEAIASLAGNIYPKDKLVETFKQGDAKELKFPDSFFDITYTTLVLEQVPRPADYLRIIREMKRVTKNFCCFLEPWDEAQNFFTRSSLKYVDYFCESHQILESIGFTKVSYLPLDFHHNHMFKLGLVISEI